MQRSGHDRVDPHSRPLARPGFFHIINASTTDFSRPFAMDLRRDEIASDHQTLQIHVRRLQFLTDEKTLPDKQLWGAHFGDPK